MTHVRRPSIEKSDRKSLLLSVHGIRTLGKWQDTLTGELSRLTIVHHPFRYGYFPVVKFLFAPSRQKVIEAFREWYSANCCEFEPDAKLRAARRPSIIAHSFGSSIVGECMLKYRDVKFDKIILCGAILPRTFEWGPLLARNQVWLVRNEYGLQDRWAKLAGRFVRHMGASGARGFLYESPCIQQERFVLHRHSDYFSPAHIATHWLPFLKQSSLTVEVVHGREVRDAQQFQRWLNRAHDIDSDAYGKDPSYAQVELPRGLTLQWIQANPDIYTFLIDARSRRLVGYLNAMPLEENTFRDIVSGRLNDNDVRAEDILSYDRGGLVRLYLMSIAIDPGARQISDGLQPTFEILMWALEEKLIDAWRRFGTQVREIGAVAWTLEGRRICEALGMQPQARDQGSHSTYLLSVQSADLSKGRYFSLVENVRKAYSAGR